MEIVIASKYKLPRLDGKYSEGNKKLIAEKRKVSRKYVDEINANAESSGLMYIVDEKLTVQWKKDHADQVEKRRAADVLEKEAGKGLLSLMGSVKSAVNDKTDPAPAAPAAESAKDKKAREDAEAQEIADKEELVQLRKEKAERESEPEFIEKKATKKDLDANPALVEGGAKVGDTIRIPNPKK